MTHLKFLLTSSLFAVGLSLALICPIHGMLMTRRMLSRAIAVMGRGIVSNLTSRPKRASAISSILRLRR